MKNDNLKFKIEKNKGQIALVVLAIMAIALTTTVSVSQRVINDLRVSYQQQESAKAFLGAEAGMEEALRRLKSGEEIAQIDTEQIAESVGISEIVVNAPVTQGGGEEFNYPITLQPGQTAVIWLRDHNSDGTLNESAGYDGTSINFCWQTGAAVEVIYFYRSGGNYSIRRFAFDTNETRRSGENHFSAPGLGSCADLSVGATLDLTAGTPLFLVARPFYQSTQVTVEGLPGQTIPVQGAELTSAGSVAQGATKIARKIRVFRGWSAPPSSFFQGLFSGTGVSGN
jgi:Tfp pilus assembly protein PilX